MRCHVTVIKFTMSRNISVFSGQALKNCRSLISKYARIDGIPDPMAMYAADLCTLPASLAGLPAISVPCGLADGLPVGFQVMAPALADDRCYRVGAALEAALDAARGHRLLDELADRGDAA